VLLVNPGGGGRFRVSVNCGDVPQVPTQWTPLSGLSAELQTHPVCVTAKITSPKNEDQKDLIHMAQMFNWQMDLRNIFLV
jgi:hypothetical protein